MNILQGSRLFFYYRCMLMGANYSRSGRRWLLHCSRSTAGPRPSFPFGACALEIIRLYSTHVQNWNGLVTLQFKDRYFLLNCYYPVPCSWRSVISILIDYQVCCFQQVTADDFLRQFMTISWSSKLNNFLDNRIKWEGKSFSGLGGSKRPWWTGYETPQTSKARTVCRTSC